MATQVMDVLGERLSLIGTTIVVSLVAFVVQRLFSQDPLSKVPWIGFDIGGLDKRRKAFHDGAKNIYKEGYEKVPLLIH
jgi:hypothetical protein